MRGRVSPTTYLPSVGTGHAWPSQHKHIYSHLVSTHTPVHLYCNAISSRLSFLRDPFSVLRRNSLFYSTQRAPHYIEYTFCNTGTPAWRSTPCPSRLPAPLNTSRPSHSPHRHPTPCISTYITSVHYIDNIFPGCQHELRAASWPECVRKRRTEDVQRRSSFQMTVEVEWR